MLTFLYDLPNWAIGLIIVGTVTIGSVGGYLLAHRFLRIDVADDGRGLAMSVLGVVATVNSLLLAFSAVFVWESFGAAEAAVAAEADAVGALARNLAIYGTPEAMQARQALQDYTQLVIDQEWAAMRHGDAAPEAWTLFDRIFRVVGTIEPVTPRETALLPEIWEWTNELLKHRRDRLLASQSEVPSTLFSVVLIGTVLTMAVTFVLPVSRFNLAMIATLSLSVGLVFYFILAMDRPFAGEHSISPLPYLSALDNIERWDRESGK